MGAALSAPVINDVATDPSDPPAFQKSRHAPELSDQVKNVSTHAALDAPHHPRRRVVL